jgi:hypothetical protein
MLVGFENASHVSFVAARPFDAALLALGVARWVGAERQDRSCLAWVDR